MYANYINKAKKNITTIFVGEHYVTNENEIIHTLLGSCISVCLMDELNNVYGMNHFLLPGENHGSEHKNNTRLGVNLMQLLIDDMLKMGADMRNVKAKVFGGAKVLKNASGAITVNDDNIRFANQFLEDNGIPIVAQKVGGKSGRKIYFDTEDGSVYIEEVAINNN